MVNVLSQLCQILAVLTTDVQMLLDLIQSRRCEIKTFSHSLHQETHLLFHRHSGLLLRRLIGLIGFVFMEFSRRLRNGWRHRLRLCQMSGWCPLHRGSSRSRSLTNFRLSLWSVHRIRHTAHVQYKCETYSPFSFLDPCRLGWQSKTVRSLNSFCSYLNGLCIALREFQKPQNKTCVWKNWCFTGFRFLGFVSITFPGKHATEKLTSTAT